MKKYEDLLKPENIEEFVRNPPSISFSQLVGDYDEYCNKIDGSGDCVIHEKDREEPEVNDNYITAIRALHASGKVGFVTSALDPNNGRPLLDGSVFSMGKQDGFGMVMVPVYEGKLVEFPDELVNDKIKEAYGALTDELYKALVTNGIVKEL